MLIPPSNCEVEFSLEERLIKAWEELTSMQSFHLSCGNPSVKKAERERGS
jgi:hypothetical protein